jgi:preprotein translocase subunit YajC
LLTAALIFQIDPPALLAQSAGGSSAGLLMPLLLMVVFFGFMYLVMIRPQQVRQRKWNEVVSTLKSGDRVVTSGGFRAIIARVKDDSFVLRVPPDNLQIEVLKTAVISVITEDEKK